MKVLKQVERLDNDKQVAELKKKENCIMKFITNQYKYLILRIRLAVNIYTKGLLWEIEKVVQQTKISRIMNFVVKAWNLAHIYIMSVYIVNLVMVPSLIPPWGGMEVISR